MPGNRFIFQLIKSSVQTSLGKRRQSLPISRLILVSCMVKQGGRQKVVLGMCLLFIHRTDFLLLEMCSNLIDPGL